MALKQPATFTLTPEEAAALQSIQTERQASIARKGPVLRYSSLAAPFVAAAMIWLVDIIWYGGDMPLSFFVTLLAVFMAGMMFQTAGYWINMLAARKRMLAATRQVYAPRTVRLTRDGIENAIPTATTLQKWAGVTQVETQKDMLLVWAGNLLPVSVPLRAFASDKDARAFVAECKRRVQQ